MNDIMQSCLEYQNNKTDVEITTKESSLQNKEINVVENIEEIFEKKPKKYKNKKKNK